MPPDLLKNILNLLGAATRELSLPKVTASYGQALTFEPLAVVTEGEFTTQTGITPARHSPALMARSVRLAAHNDVPMRETGTLYCGKQVLRYAGNRYSRSGE
jgi:hypothetical protein